MILTAKCSPLEKAILKPAMTPMTIRATIPIAKLIVLVCD